MKLSSQAKSIILIAVFVACLGSTVALASLNQTLLMNKSGKGTSTRWDVNFSNIALDSISGSAEEIEAPALTSTSVTNYSVALKKPGDSVTYTFDVTNEGNADAKLSMVKISTPECTADDIEDAKILCNNVEYTVTYKDGTKVSEGDILKAKESREVVLKVSYKNSNKVPKKKAEVTNLDVTMIYVQK